MDDMVVLQVVQGSWYFVFGFNCFFGCFEVVDINFLDYIDFVFGIYISIFSYIVGLQVAISLRNLVVV